MSFYCALLSNHLRDFNKLSKLADCTRGLLVIYILHDIFYLSLTCRIIFNFMAIDSPNSPANLKLTILLCKRKKWCLCSVNVLKKKKLPWSLCLYCSVCLSWDDLLLNSFEKSCWSYTCAWGKIQIVKKKGNSLPISLCFPCGLFRGQSPLTSFFE